MFDTALSTVGMRKCEHPEQCCACSLQAYNGAGNISVAPVAASTYSLPGALGFPFPECVCPLTLQFPTGNYRHQGGPGSAADPKRCSNFPGTQQTATCHASCLHNAEVS